MFPVGDSDIAMNEDNTPLEEESTPFSISYKHPMSSSK